MMNSFLSGRSPVNNERALTTQREQSGGGFQPLFSKPSPSSLPEANSCDGQAEPQLEIVNGKDGIERIIVVCTCGKRIEMKCEYE